MPRPRLAHAVLLLAALGLAALWLAACSGSAPTAAPSAKAASVVPVIVSSQQSVGPNRFVFSFLDAATNLPAAASDRTASVAFLAPGATEPGPAVPAEFVWAVEGSRGEYVASTDFTAPGDWKAIFVTAAPGKPQEAIGVAFQVAEKGVTVAVGDKAPASDTPTLASVGGDIAHLSTDPKPDPDFYQLSVKDAIAQGKAFVLVFATPAFCKSAQCGPTLDRVKKVKAEAPANVAFINVEPYQLQFTEGRLQPVLDPYNQLQPVQAVSDWQILSEPWIFTVDRQGVVQGSFEGVVSEQELRDAVKAISSS